MLLWSHQSSTGDLFLLRFREALQPLTWLAGPQMAWPCIHLCRHLLCRMVLPGRPAAWASLGLVSTSGPLMLSSEKDPFSSFTCLTLVLKSLLKGPSFRGTSLQPQFLPLSLSAPSPCCCSGFSLVVVSGGCSSCGARAPRALEGPCWPLVGTGVQSPAAERRLHSAGAGWAAPRRVGSSWTGMEPVSYIGRGLVYHWAPGEAQAWSVNPTYMLSSVHCLGVHPFWIDVFIHVSTVCHLAPLEGKILEDGLCLHSCYVGSVNTWILNECIESKLFCSHSKGLM